ncbi:MAG: efflux RND transporter permease subunit, partial [Spirochaetales bacterium]|nr:efflux RND transporter permease subunit [Spirochaetales bacterium]
MSLANRVVARPVTWLVVFALIVGLGLYMTTLLPVDQFPEIQPPIIMVSTTYEDADPETVEWSVTRVLEGAMANVSGIEEMTSTTSQGSSQIVLSFSWGTDLTEAKNDIRDKLDQVRDYLPDEAASPSIFEFDPSSMPILRLAVGGDRTPEELY